MGMGRVRTKKLTEREMGLWVSGYNKGVDAGLRLAADGIEAARKNGKINAKDPKDVARKFK